MMLKSYGVNSAHVLSLPVLSIHPRSTFLPNRNPRVAPPLKTKSSSVSRRLEICCSFGVDNFVDSVPLVRSVSTLLSSVSLLLGAFFIGQQLLAPEQDRFESGERCPRCNGTGFEPCFCTRWSDGDVGCPSCNHTGATRCSACGGGGKAIPLSVFVEKDKNSRNY